MKKLFFIIIAMCVLSVSLSHLTAQEAAEEIKKGLIRDFSINHKLFNTTKEYFADIVPKKVYRAYTKGGVPSNWTDANKITPEECVEYKPEEHSAIVYVPQSYDGTEPYGIYLHITPSDGGLSPDKSYQDMMDKLKLIMVSPNKTSNSESNWRRIVLAMDSMATAKHHYKVDNNRVFVGGLSGGGHMAMFCQVLYPEYFKGAISHAAQSYLPDKTGNNCGHFPGLRLSDVKKSPRKDKKWAIVSGDKDQNYQRILAENKSWESAKFDFKFFDVPGMGHHNAPADTLEEILTWMDAEKEKSSPSSRLRR